MYILLINNCYDDFLVQRFKIFKSLDEAKYWFKDEVEFATLNSVDESDKDTAIKKLSQLGYKITDTEYQFKGFLNDSEYFSVDICKLEEL